ncbi:MAG: PAS domain S-box protein [Methanosarcina sp.]
MREKLRKSGIDIIGDVPWGAHICQFYETKEDLTDILVPYFKAGLENNELCLWVTSQPLEIEDAKEALRKAIRDLDSYLYRGQIEIIPYTDWFTSEEVFDSEKVLNGWLEKLHYASDSGYDGMRLSGNTSWLDKEDWNGFVEYKEQADNVIGNYRMITLCTYSLDKHNTAEIINLVVNHQFSLIKREGKWERIESSKRKKAEEEAIQATKNWEYIFDAVPDLIAIINNEYRVVRANRAMAARLGMKPEECVGLTCYHVIHGTDKPPSFCPHRQLLKDELEHTKEVFEDQLGGNFIVSVSPLHDSEGKLTGCIHVARDINERKRAEEALRQSEEKYRNIVDTATEGIWIIDAEDRTTYVNEKMVEMLGYSQEEMIGRSAWDFTEEENKAIRRLNMEKRQQGIDESHEFKFICKDGSPLLTLVNTESFFDKDGKFTGSMGMLTDVTKRKEAEDKLKETLDNLEKLVEERTTQLEKAYNSLKESEKGLAEAQKMAHIGNWEWDIVTDKAYWSEEMYHLFGRDPQKLAPSYNEYLSYIHPDDRNYFDGAAKKAVNGKPYSIDHRIILATGEELTVHIQSEVMFNDEDVPIRIKGIVQDITEHKKAEEKIQSLANIVESSNDAIGTISLDGIITSWNKGAEQIYGYSAEEVLGKAASIVAPFYLVEETNILSERIKKGIKIHRYETSRLRKDGRIINVSINLSPIFDVYGKLIAISFVVRDITERKEVEEKLRESEEKYRNIVETANEGILIIDAEAIVTYANKKMTDMLGYTLEEGIGRPTWDFISEECKAIAKLNLEKRRQGVNESYEVELICKDGSSLWVLVNAKSLYDKAGKFTGSIGMLTDITKRKEAEEALTNIEIARKKEIHHRIKNNLQVVSSLLDLQAEMFRDRGCVENSEVLKAFRESQERVMSIALIHEELHEGRENDTLNFSIYLEKLVKNLFQTYRLGNTDTRLNLDLEENIFFDMDIAVPLGIIINELVSNSLKYAFPGREKGLIQIKLYREESGECTNNILTSKKIGCKYTNFVLTVSDNGVGMPESFNSESSDSLGLQLVTILVVQLNGELELKRNKGTEFTMRFKVK